MERTAVVLAGGLSQRFGRDKGLVRLAGKPLVSHVLERVRRVVKEVIVVVSSNAQKESYSRLLPDETTILVDVKDSHSPLVGVLTGFQKARGANSVLMACDTPFVSREVIQLLFQTSSGVDAVVPRWPNGYIEPLQAVYRTRPSLSAAEEAVNRGEARMQAMISLLGKVKYLSTTVIQRVDPHLTTFFNINTQADLEKAEELAKSGALSHDFLSRGHTR